MKVIFAIAAFAFSLTAHADQPGYNYPPPAEPPPLEQLEQLEEPQQPCHRPCQVPVRPTCIRGNACGSQYGQYQQSPVKVCSVVEVSRRRYGQLFVVVRFGQQLTYQPKSYQAAVADAVHYNRNVIEADDRPFCEVVNLPY